jgi:hypothetical protein
MLACVGWPVSPHAWGMYPSVLSHSLPMLGFPAHFLMLPLLGVAEKACPDRTCSIAVQWLAAALLGSRDYQQHEQQPLAHRVWIRWADDSH